MMATDDPLEAAAIGRAALDDAGRIRSRRASHYLRELDTVAARHRTMDEVADLRRQLGGLVAP